VFSDTNLVHSLLTTLSAALELASMFVALVLTMSRTCSAMITVNSCCFVQLCRVQCVASIVFIMDLGTGQDVRCAPFL
jgi:hypothetical protein